jgi:hypothetical protein
MICHQNPANQEFINQGFPRLDPKHHGRLSAQKIQKNTMSENHGQGEGRTGKEAITSEGKASCEKPTTNKCPCHP